ncbi:MAG: Dps family protein [Flavobacterium sp.]|jgi:starvation-inducible DNA-binding protein
MKTQIGITEPHLEKVAHSLSAILADEYVLYTKTRKAHWNVEGDDFYNKHLFFEQQFTQLNDIVDAVAERIRVLGHYAPASLKLFLELTHLTEQSFEKNDSLSLIQELLIDHETIIIHLRENITVYANDFQDLGTSDFITGLMETHEKMAWMLRSHLK